MGKVVARQGNTRMENYRKKLGSREKHKQQKIRGTVHDNFTKRRHRCGFFFFFFLFVHVDGRLYDIQSLPVIHPRLLLPRVCVRRPVAGRGIS